MLWQERALSQSSKKCPTWLQLVNTRVVVFEVRGRSSGNTREVSIGYDREFLNLIQRKNRKPDLPALNIIHAKFRIIFV